MRHDVRWSPLLAQFVCHEAHIGSEMPKEHLVGRTQIIQSIFSFGRGHKAMFGTLPVTGKLDVTFTTYLRQLFLLLLTESDLLGTERHLC